MDKFNRNWITRNSLDVISEYEKGVLTLRALHYQLVGLGMTNSQSHYKRVVSAMIAARWDGSVSFDAFSDHDRQVIGFTDADPTSLENSIETGKRQIRAWMNHYSRARWENQPIYPEVWIEKKALQEVFEGPCSEMEVALVPCKGYPSLTFLHEAKGRFEEALDYRQQKPVILYFGDYDASGEDIPRSIQSNFSRFGVEVDLRRICLKEEQVVAWELPPAPTKEGDSRAKNWDGLGQVELDAVNPKKLQDLCLDAIREVFDEELYEELLIQEEAEKKDYRSALKDYVDELGDS